jgi:hypothetical protein
MKRYIKITATIAILFALSAGCKKWIDTNINIDPDRPLDVPMKLLLPSIQAHMAYDIGGNDAVRITGILMQHLDGVGRQSLAQGHYNINDSDPDNLWNDMYASAMENIVILIKKAGEQNSPQWAGIGKIMLAQCIGFVTDLWGDVPYSQAFLGFGNLAPTFDTQQSIYAVITGLLTDGIADLDQTSAIPVSGDMVYGGDLSLWKKAGNALLARYLMHTVNVDASVKSQIPALIDASFTSNDEDMQFQYGPNGSTEATPLFQFQQQRTGDIAMCGTLVNFLSSTSDPRLAAYVAKDENGNYTGSPAGAANELASVPNPDNIYWTAAGITTFTSYVEAQFLKAEALLGTDNAGAVAAYKNAVQASLEKHGVFDQAWFDSNIGVETAGTINLTKIWRQKWVAMFSQVEVYNDWRRSNNEIGLALAKDALISQIPYAYPYGVTEQTTNKNCPQGRDLIRKMWWMGSANPTPTK